MKQKQNNRKKIHITLQEQPIGQGSQGSVFAATGDNKLRYAVKYQKQMHSDEEEFLKKMIEEQSSQKLIKIHEFYKQEEYKITVQDLYESQNIKQLIQKMNKEDVKSVIQQVGEQLEYIHSICYIYLDLKPENIVWRQNNQGQKEYKICDFGSIRKYRESFSPSLSEHRGTKQYNPHDKKIDYSNDIWSFGALIYELHKKQQLFDELKEINEYFSNKSSQISDYIDSLDMSVTEKIFLSLMLEKNQINRPNIQQINQFYRSTQLEQKMQLIFLLEHQQKFTEQMNFNIKQIEFDSIYGQYQYIEQSKANNSQNQLITYQPEILQKQMRFSQENLLEVKSRVCSNHEKPLFSIEFKYLNANDKESKIINFFKEENYQTLTEFEENSKLLFDFFQISQAFKIQMQDFIKNLKELNNIEKLTEKNNQTQKEYSQKKIKQDQQEKELKKQKDSLDIQLYQLKSLKNQVDSQEAELLQLKKIQKNMEQQRKDYEDLKEKEAEMKQIEKQYQKLKDLRQNVENNKTKFEQLKNQQYYYQEKLQEYNKLIELENQVNAQNDRYQELKSKEKEMKEELEDYEKLANMKKKFLTQKQDYDQLLKQKKILIHKDMEQQIYQHLQKIENLEKDFKAKYSEYKNKEQDYQKKIQTLESKNKDLQKQTGAVKENKNYQNGKRKFIVKNDKFTNELHSDNLQQQSHQNQIQPQNSPQIIQNNRFNNHRRLKPTVRN